MVLAFTQLIWWAHLFKYSINETDESVLEKIKEIENKINLLKKELKTAVNLNEKVEINTKIHKLKEELNKLTEIWKTTKRTANEKTW